MTIQVAIPGLGGDYNAGVSAEIALPGVAGDFTDTSGSPVVSVYTPRPRDQELARPRIDMLPEPTKIAPFVTQVPPPVVAAVFTPRPGDQDQYRPRVDRQPDPRKFAPFLVQVPPPGIFVPRPKDQDQYQPRVDRQLDQVKPAPFLFQHPAYTLGNIISMRQSVATAVAIHLPAVPAIGKLYLITDTLGVTSLDNFTVKDASGSTVYTMNSNGVSVGFYWDGTGWVTAFIS